MRFTITFYFTQMFLHSNDNRSIQCGLRRRAIINISVTLSHKLDLIRINGSQSCVCVFLDIIVVIIQNKERLCGIVQSCQHFVSINIISATPITTVIKRYTNWNVPVLVITFKCNYLDTNQCLPCVAAINYVANHWISSILNRLGCNGTDKWSESNNKMNSKLRD